MLKSRDYINIISKIRKFDDFICNELNKINDYDFYIHYDNGCIVVFYKLKSHKMYDVNNNIYFYFNVAEKCNEDEIKMVIGKLR